MISRHFNILFTNGKPITSEEITGFLDIFGKSYTKTIRNLISNSNKLSEETFKVNVARLLCNFKMTRRGPFFGIKITDSGEILDPKGKLLSCWDTAKPELLLIKKILDDSDIQPRSRALILLNSEHRAQIVSMIWKAFKNMLPVTNGEKTLGIVGASKILFAVFPEIVLPLDNVQWLHVFQTVDLGDVINTMAEEIIAWEKATGLQLQNCDKEAPQFTLPAVYNVMAMEARPKSESYDN